MKLVHILGFVAELFMPAMVLLLVYIMRPEKDKQLRLVIIYTACCLAIYTVTVIFSLNKVRNLYIYHFFSLFEFAILGYYLLGLIQKRQNTPLFYISITAYFILWVVNIIFFEPLTSFNCNTAGIACLLLLLMCMFHLLSLSKGEEILYFQNLPSFWIVSGIMVYAALSLLVYLSYTYYIITEKKDEGNDLWNIASVATIIKFALISVGLLCYKRKQPSSQPSLSS